MITQKCNFCGNEFDAVRISAKYCSKSCKTKANMLRRREEQELAGSIENSESTIANVLPEKTKEAIKPESKMEEGGARIFGVYFPQETLNQIFENFFRAITK